MVSGPVRCKRFVLLSVTQPVSQLSTTHHDGAERVLLSVTQPVSHVITVSQLSTTHNDGAEKGSFCCSQRPNPCHSVTAEHGSPRPAVSNRVTASQLSTTDHDGAGVQSQTTGRTMRRP